MSAVGALPIAKISGRSLIRAAYSMLTTARVTPRAQAPVDASVCELSLSPAPRDRASADASVMGIEVDGADLELAPIVGVHQPGGVGHGEPLLEGKTTSGLHEACIAIGNGDGKTGADKPPLKGSQHNVLVRPQVEASVTLVGIGRELDRWVKPLDGKVDGIARHF